MPNVTENIKDGLVSYYPCNEESGTTVEDVHGNNDAVLTNANARGSNGIIDRCLSLDASNEDYAEAPDSSSLDITEAIAISVWIQVASWDSTGQQIVGKGDEAYAVRRFDDDNDIAFNLRDNRGDNFGAGSWGLSSGLTISTNTWYHIVANWDGQTQQIYVNGNLENSISANELIGVISEGLQIGCNYNGSDYRRFWDGLIDELGLWNRALTQEEIDFLYNEGNGNSYDAFVSLDTSESLFNISGKGVVLFEGKTPHAPHPEGVLSNIIEDSPFSGSSFSIKGVGKVDFEGYAVEESISDPADGTAEIQEGFFEAELVLEAEVHGQTPEVPANEGFFEAEIEFETLVQGETPEVPANEGFFEAELVLESDIIGQTPEVPANEGFFEAELVLESDIMGETPDDEVAPPEETSGHLEAEMLFDAEVHGFTPAVPTTGHFEAEMVMDAVFRGSILNHGHFISTLELDFRPVGPISDQFVRYIKVNGQKVKVFYRFKSGE